MSARASGSRRRLDPRLERARSAIPVTGASTYLATGSWGPLSRPYAATLRRATLEELREGRMTAERFEVSERATGQIRAALAALLGTDPGRIALTRSTTAGLAAVIRDFPWAPGDEVICTQLEHQAVTAPLAEEARRRGFSVRIAQVPEEGADELGWLTKCVTHRTRLIAFTGVSYTTGQRLPIEAIGAFAREQGIGTLLDAAQCAGAMPLDPARSRIDCCAFPLQKWLLGPEGMGALYVHEQMPGDLLRDRLSQSRGVLEATATHLEWLGHGLGWSWIFERTHALAARAREQLASTPGVRIVTPQSHAGLVTIEVDPGRGPEIAAKLERRRIALRSWPELGRYRLSTAFFNTEKEIASTARLFRAR